MSDALTTPRIIFCRVQPPELYRKNLKVAPPPLAVYSYKVRNQIAFTVVINDLFTAIRSYHTAGRPTGVSNGILDITGDKSLVHTYDGQACRVTRTVREWSGTGWRATETVQFIYDGWNPIAKYFSDESPPEVYLWGLDLSGTLQGAGGVGGLLVTRWASESGQPDYFPTYDGNGHVSEYLDTAGTNIVHYEYDPFGGLTRLTGNTSTRFQYRFSTKPRDLSTGLYNYGYRYYDPLTGRWPSRDPIEEVGGVNLYGFVGNDGVNKWDLLGMFDYGDAEKLLEEYMAVRYTDFDENLKPLPGGMDYPQVWAFVGGDLQKAQESENPAFQDSCALRLSIAFSRTGVDFNNVDGSKFAKGGNWANLGGKKHVMLSASKMLSYLKKTLGKPTLSDTSEYKVNEMCEDILIWGSDGHVGMGPSSNLDIGGVFRGVAWVYTKPKEDKIKK